MADRTAHGPLVASGAHAVDPGAAHERLFRSLFEHSPMQVHVWQVLRGDHGAMDEVFADPEAVRAWWPVVEAIMASGQPREWEGVFGGTQQQLRMVCIPVGDGFISTGVDVTHEHARQQELERALQRVTQATQAGGVGLWDWDLHTNAVHYSEAWKPRRPGADAGRRARLPGRPRPALRRGRAHAAPRRLVPLDPRPGRPRCCATRTAARRAWSARRSTSPSGDGWKTACATRRSSSPWARWPPASRTTSTTCSPRSAATSRCCARCRWRRRSRPRC